MAPSVERILTLQRLAADIAEVVRLHDDLDSRDVPSTPSDEWDRWVEAKETLNEKVGDLVHRLYSLFPMC